MSLTPADSVQGTLSCTYPGTDWPPDAVTFRAHPSLGANTLDVHAEILRRLVTASEFELPAVGEPPFLYCSETVRAVVVR